MVKKVGFIGLGEMGLPTAKRLAAHGFQLTVCGHVRKAPLEAMRAVGAKVVNNPKEVAAASEVTITMVRDELESMEVIAGVNGLLAGAAKGTGIILSSTLPPAFCRKIAELAKEKGVGVLDAPVAGAPAQAETGEQGVYVGGDKETVDKHRNVLETMGQLVHCGGVGMGETIKLVNNMLASLNGMAVSEALSWGVRNGATEEELIKYIKMGSGTSWIIENFQWVRPMWGNDADPQPLTWQIAAKDLSYALKIGLELRQPCPLVGLACELYKGNTPKIPSPSKNA
jgi:3-hydroxyisobutyrate dehydrogenase